LVFSYDFRRGLSDQRGMNEGFCLILLAVENTCQMPFAVMASPFSTYFIGACMQSLSWCYKTLKTRASALGGVRLGWVISTILAAKP
jgi:hypothetical protein